MKREGNAWRTQWLQEFMLRLESKHDERPSAILATRWNASLRVWRCIGASGETTVPDAGRWRTTIG